MKKAILIHGYHIKEHILDPTNPTPSNNQWFPWLSKQLYMRNILPIAIEMPQPWYPVYDEWKRELERFDLDEDTILVGHSYGGGFLVRYLSESNIKVGKVILVAPYVGIEPDGNAVDGKWQDPAFFKFTIDKDLVQKTAGVTVFASTNDKPNILESIKFLQENVDNIKVITVENAGHFRIKDGYLEFPKLLEEIN